MNFSRLKLVVGGALIATSLVLLACSDDDDDGGSVSVSGTGSNSASSSASASGAPVEPGVVETKPGDATQVDVTLREFAIETSVDSVAAGQVYFLVENAGPDDPHEFVVIKTDLEAEALPVVEGSVPEEDVDLIDEIEPFAPASSASLTLGLEAGSYVFICNIAEIEEGELESHYEEGMRIAFTVE